VEAIMKRQSTRENALILAIGRWSQTAWERADGLREVVERSLLRPSIRDIIPPLVGLDPPLYLASPDRRSTISAPSTGMPVVVQEWATTSLAGA